MSNAKKVLYLLTVLKIILPFLLQHNYYQPHRDEFLYLAEGQHLSWGYMEVPPLLSFFAWLTNCFGNSLFWIKIWPALFGGLTFFLAGRIVLMLGGKSFALFLTFLPFATMFLRLNFLFQPGFLEVFCWTLCAFTLLRYLLTERNSWLYFFGISAALAILSKYTSIFYLASLLIALLFTPYRKIFLNRHLYFAGMLALVMIAPNIYWQYMHRFPVFTHMKELQDTQLQFVSRKEFLLGQLKNNTLVIYLPVAAFLFMFTVKGKPFRVFGIAYVLLITYMAWMHAKAYYVLGVYPVLHAIGAYHIEALTERRLRVIPYILAGLTCALAIYVLPLLIPVMKPAQLADYYKKSKLEKNGFKWEDLKQHPLPQDFADMFGWKETTHKVAAAYKLIPAEDRPYTLIYCPSYAFAGALNFYGPALGLPKALSTNASFLFWMPDRYQVKNLLLVAHNIPDENDPVFRQFSTGAMVDSMVNPLARENGIRVMLYEGADPKINHIIETTIAKEKAKFTRTGR